MSKSKNEKDTIISSFKKFSQISSDSEKNDTVNPNLTELPFDDGDLPANPNLPGKSGRTQKGMSTDYMMPLGQEVENTSERKVEFFGKVAKLPKGVKASKGYNFLENVKVSKSSIWYLMVEKQDNELQMVKYNHKKGVDLSRFISDLKEFYKSQFKDNHKVLEMIEKIAVDGNDKFSRICNIPLIEIEGKKIITKITEDLIKLLGK